ncbi:phage tail protein [Fusobacterium nucleatum]|uniref:phage tail-collar fiber domain-containing protein n=2 Tax=Fusobacterium TaxID=848 RepID=UPI0030D5EDE4
MKFSGLTKKGRLYLAKIQAAEEPIQFTKIKFGDGKLSEHENPADLVDIKNIKVEKSILNKEQKEDAVILTTIIDNVGLVEGYFPRETGIYVQDEDQEVLYFYMNDGDETSWLPPEVDGPHRMEMKINLISSNTGSVLVHNDGKDLYITKDYLESNYTQKGNFNGTAQDIEDRVVAAVGKEDGKFPLTESVAGNIYYFPGNKKFYYCLKSQTSRVSVPNADFEELSIYQNRKKLENLFKYSEIFKGRAATKGQTLGTIPSNSKFIEIIGINYGDDNNFYYFTPIILRTEIIRNRDIAFTVGITSDTREFVLSFKNNVITITHSAVTNSTADNNFIAQILSVNS